MHPPSTSRTDPHATPRRWRRAGWVCLAVGVVGSGLTRWAMPRPKPVDALITPDNLRSYEFAMERIGGKSVVFAARLNDWLDSLWQADRLPYTVLALALLAALICFGLAHLLSIALDDELPPP